MIRHNAREFLVLSAGLSGVLDIGQLSHFGRIMNTASAWLRSSFRGTAATAATGHLDGRSLDGGPLMDPNVCFETFQRHWQQLRDITTVQVISNHLQSHLHDMNH